MTRRPPRFSAVWPVALAVALAVLFVCAREGQRLRSLPPEPGWAVFLGSSLTEAAFPLRFDLASTLPQGPPGAVGVRRHIGGLHPAWMMDQAFAAVRSGARLVVLEAGPFLFAQEPSPWLRAVLFAQRCRQGLRSLVSNAIGRDSATVPTPRPTHAWDARDYAGTRPSLSDFGYPHELPRLLDEARASGALVVLVVFPRPQTAHDARHPAWDREVEPALARLAREHDVPLWRPAPVWPDHLFVDHGHLNRAGRARWLDLVKTLPTPGAAP